MDHRDLARSRILKKRINKMKNSKVLKVILFVSGLIAAVIGSSILLMPETFYALNSIDLGGNTSLLNEIRASGGALVVTGVLIISGSLVARLTFTSIVVAVLLFFSYGLSRILSFRLDGMPSAGLVQAAALELVIATVCLFVFVKYRE